MNKSKTAAILTTAVLAGVMALPLVRAADDTPTTQPTQREGRFNRAGGQRFDPAKMKDFMLGVYQKQLDMSDDDFAAIKPQLSKVIDLQAEMNSGRARMFAQRGGRNGGRGGDRANGDNADRTPAQPQSAVAKASADLRTLLEDKDAKPQDIKAKLDALRDAKTKAQTDLTKAQDDLKALLSQRQEATLVMSGVLQ